MSSNTNTELIANKKIKVLTIHIVHILLFVIITILCTESISYAKKKDPTVIMFSERLKFNDPVEAFLHFKKYPTQSVVLKFADGYKFVLIKSVPDGTRSHNFMTDDGNILHVPISNSVDQNDLTGYIEEQRIGYQAVHESGIQAPYLLEVSPRNLWLKVAQYIGDKKIKNLVHYLEIKESLTKWKKERVDKQLLEFAKSTHRYTKLGPDFSPINIVYDHSRGWLWDDVSGPVVHATETDYDQTVFDHLQELFAKNNQSKLYDQLINVILSNRNYLSKKNRRSLAEIKSYSVDEKTVQAPLIKTFGELQAKTLVINFTNFEHSRPKAETMLLDILRASENEPKIAEKINDILLNSKFDRQTKADSIREIIYHGYENKLFFSFEEPPRMNGITKTVEDIQAFDHNRVTQRIAHEIAEYLKNIKPHFHIRAKKLEAASDYFFNRCSVENRWKTSRILDQIVHIEWKAKILEGLWDAHLIIDNAKKSPQYLSTIPSTSEVDAVEDVMDLLTGYGANANNAREYVFSLFHEGVIGETKGRAPSSTAIPDHELDDYYSFFDSPSGPFQILLDYSDEMAKDDEYIPVVHSNFIKASKNYVQQFKTEKDAVLYIEDNTLEKVEELLRSYEDLYIMGRYFGFSHNTSSYFEDDRLNLLHAYAEIYVGPFEDELYDPKAKRLPKEEYVYHSGRTLRSAYENLVKENHGKIRSRANDTSIPASTRLNELKVIYKQLGILERNAKYLLPQDYIKNSRFKDLVIIRDDVLKKIPHSQNILITKIHDTESEVLENERIVQRKVADYTSESLNRIYRRVLTIPDEYRDVFSLQERQRDFLVLKLKADDDLAIIRELRSQPSENLGAQINENTYLLEKSITEHRYKLAGVQETVLKASAGKRFFEKEIKDPEVRKLYYELMGQVPIENKGRARATLFYAYELNDPQKFANIKDTLAVTQEFIKLGVPEFAAKIIVKKFSDKNVIGNYETYHIKKRHYEIHNNPNSTINELVINLRSLDSLMGEDRKRARRDLYNLSSQYKRTVADIHEATYLIDAMKRSLGTRLAAQESFQILISKYDEILRSPDEWIDISGKLKLINDRELLIHAYENVFTETYTSHLAFQVRPGILATIQKEIPEYHGPSSLFPLYYKNIFGAVKDHSELALNEELDQSDFDARKSSLEAHAQDIQDLKDKSENILANSELISASRYDEAHRVKKMIDESELAINNTLQNMNEIYAQKTSIDSTLDISRIHFRANELKSRELNIATSDDPSYSIEKRITDLTTLSKEIEDYNDYVSRYVKQLSTANTGYRTRIQRSDITSEVHVHGNTLAKRIEHLNLARSFLEGQVKRNKADLAFKTYQEILDSVSPSNKLEALEALYDAHIVSQKGVFSSKRALVELQIKFKNLYEDDYKIAIAKLNLDHSQNRGLASVSSESSTQDVNSQNLKSKSNWFNERLKILKNAGVIGSP